MSCFRPLVGYRSKDINDSGKRSIVFNPRQALEADNPLSISCGQCIGCRLAYSARWAARCFHESTMHKENCFLTLTFDDEHLPKDGSVRVRDCQLFLKRYRKFIYPRKIRYAYCGEYGEKFRRPHYHFLIFGHDFEDKYLWSTQGGQHLYRSKRLEQLWTFGNSLIGGVTYESSAYVARYMLKKQKGKDSFLKYMDLDYSTGEILRERSPEFFHTSRRPGLASHWLKKYWMDCYPSDFFVIEGRRLKPPKYYDSQFEILNPWMMDEVLAARELAARDPRRLADNTRERLDVREEVKHREISTLSRRFERG